MKKRILSLTKRFLPKNFTFSTVQWIALGFIWLLFWLTFGIIVNLLIDILWLAILSALIGFLSSVSSIFINILSKRRTAKVLTLLQQNLRYSKKISESQLKSLGGAINQLKTVQSSVAYAPVLKTASEELSIPTSFPAPKVPEFRNVSLPIIGEAKTEWVSSRQGGSARINVLEPTSYRLPKLRYPDELPVAMLADDFTYHSFKDEFAVSRITPSNWRQVFQQTKPVIFFCESAWAGGPPAKSPWRAKVYASVRWPKENRQELLEVIAYCRKNGIPTVFWNKEDPVHFPDRINDFVRTAALFDYVFTTAEECVDLYRRDAGVANVAALPFAVQPKIFNPIGSRAAIDQVSFAGTWYRRYPRRCREGERILDAALEAGKPITIYDRMYGSTNPQHQYPQRYQPFVHEAVDYEDTARIYKESQFGMTLNTITESTTMFARRVFELAASGSVVLSNYSRGVDEFFGDSVIFADRDPGRFINLGDNEYSSVQRNALEVALRNTYRDRAEQILKFLGIPFASRSMAPTGLVRIGSEQDVSEVQDYLADFNNHQLSTVCAIVDSNAPQTLLTTLNRPGRSPLQVFSENELINSEQRQRNWLRTSHVVLLDPHNPIQASELEFLHSCTQFTDHIVASADSPESRYQVTNAVNVTNAVIPAPLLPSAFENSEKARQVLIV